MRWWVEGPGGLGGPGGPSPRTRVPWRTKRFHTRVEPALKSRRKQLKFLLSKALSHRDLMVLGYV